VVDVFERKGLPAEFVMDNCLPRFFGRSGVDCASLHRLTEKGVVECTVKVCPKIDGLGKR
jgi:hypothetical protein